MSAALCPFSAPILQAAYQCPNAEEIIRRGGSEVACTDASSHSRCIDLHAVVKQAALDSMGLEDDLLTVPHSTFVRFQYGCLAALQNIAGGEAQDVATLVSTADVGQLPMDQILTSIEQVKIPRKTRRRER